MIFKNALKEIEKAFIFKDWKLQKEWSGFDPRTGNQVSEEKSLQRSMLLTYCNTVGNHLDLSQSRALEIGVEKHRSVCMALGLNNWERLDRLDDVGGNKTDYFFDYVEEDIPKELIGAFDVVVCSNVLEHTFDIIKGFEKTFALAKPGGLVYISTPFSLGIHGIQDYWRPTPQAYAKILPEYSSDFVILGENWGQVLQGVSSFSVKL